MINFIILFNTSSKLSFKTFNNVLNKIFFIVKKIINDLILLFKNILFEFHL
jgi:hypothetical protein